MAKAALITSANQAALANRYNIEIDDRNDMMPVGYYIVIKTFGDDHNYDVVTKEKLDAYFLPTGKMLENGFFEVVGTQGEYRTD